MSPFAITVTPGFCMAMSFPPRTGVTPLRKPLMHGLLRAMMPLFHAFQHDSGQVDDFGCFSPCALRHDGRSAGLLSIAARKSTFCWLLVYMVKWPAPRWPHAGCLCCTRKCHAAFHGHTPADITPGEIMKKSSAAFSLDDEVSRARRCAGHAAARLSRITTNNIFRCAAKRPEAYADANIVISALGLYIRCSSRKATRSLYYAIRPMLTGIVLGGGMRRHFAPYARWFRQTRKMGMQAALRSIFVYFALDMILTAGRREMLT